MDTVVGGRGNFAGERLRIVVEDIDGTRRNFPVAQLPLMIGRGRDADVILLDGVVSRHHLKVGEDNCGFFIEDQDTHNGTFLNGARIRHAYVEHGDNVRVGSVSLCFLFAGDGESAATRIHQLTGIHVPGRTRIGSVARRADGADALQPSVYDRASAEELRAVCAQLARDNEQMRREMDGVIIGVAGSLLAAIEAKDTYTCGHSQRVYRYCDAIAAQMGLPGDFRRDLAISSLCHDVGKIGIADAVLKNTGKLSDDEFTDMKEHARIGAAIVAQFSPGAEIIAGVRHHHEKWDGGGYPDGLKGGEIPLTARIIAIADSFDAMTSGRSYAGFFEQSDAVAKIQEMTDRFEAEIIAAFVRSFQEGRLTMRTGTIIA